MFYILFDVNENHKVFTKVNTCFNVCYIQDALLQDKKKRKKEKKREGKRTEVFSSTLPITMDFSPPPPPGT